MPPAKIDTDGNGSLSRQELQAVKPQFAEDKFSELDADGDGELSDEELRRVLIRVDADGDGKVSFEELRQGRLRAGDEAPSDTSK